jgi:hypothetical protein
MNGYQNQEPLLVELFSLHISESGEGVFRKTGSLSPQRRDKMSFYNIRLPEQLG